MEWEVSRGGFFTTSSAIPPKRILKIYNLETSNSERALVFAKVLEKIAEP